MTRIRQISGRMLAALVLAVLLLGAVSLKCQAAAGVNAVGGTTLTDGIYTISAVLRHSNHKQDSMGNDAIEKPLTLCVENGKATLKIGLISLTYSGKKGYLGELGYLTYDGSGVPDSSETAYSTTVLLWYSVRDSYNDLTTGTDSYMLSKSNSNYPRLVSMPVDLYDEEVWVKVYVPVMEEISTGSGTQYAALQLDWSTVTAASIDKSALSSAISSGQAILDQSSNYTSATVSVLKTAMTSAKAVYADSYAAQAEADAAAETLEAAVSAMTLKKGGTAQDSSGNTYKVTDASSLTVSYVKPANKKVTSVSVPKTVKLAGKTYKVTAVSASAFKSCTKLKKVTLGANVTQIGNNAFYGCTKLASVTLSSKLTTIGSKAFYKCTALTKITIPSKVSKIGASAFYGCKKLKTITIKTTKLTSKNVGSKAFKGIYSKAVIKVPKSKLSAYKTLLKSKGVGTGATIKK